MSDRPGDQTDLTRRRFLSMTGGVVAAAGITPSTTAAVNSATTQVDAGAIEPFWGPNQGGIVTAVQNHTYFAAFDLVAANRADVVKLLAMWTNAAARMARGLTAQPLTSDAAVPAVDSGDALGLSPARLTVTFGFGPGLFIKDGKDRYGLASRRPAALVDLPKFNGDQLIEAQTGGDLSVQACADDPQVAFHAVRQLARLGKDLVQIRWAQTGFLGSYGTTQTPRNLMGFKDGTGNPSDPASLSEFVWVGKEGPEWMQGGSFTVVRRIRIALEHWEQMPLSFQEQTVGRQKYSGAPLGKKAEFDAVDLDANDTDGNPVIPDNAHLRMATAASNEGARILRRSYSYNDGVSFTSERWPPWRQGMEYDAGLLFVSYQRDPRTGFIKIFERMAKFDMMNQFVTHVGSGLFACPAGIAEGSFVGAGLFKA